MKTIGTLDHVTQLLASVLQTDAIEGFSTLVRRSLGMEGKGRREEGGREIMLSLLARLHDNPFPGIDPTLQERAHHTVELKQRECKNWKQED